MKSTISCPYPTVCEYDAFRKTGKHFCERVVCPYAFCVARLMEWRDAYLREAAQDSSAAIRDGPERLESG